MANTQVATRRAECNSKRTKIELLHAAWLALDDFSNTHIETDEDMADMHEIVLRIERRMAEIPATTGREWACKLSLAPDYLKNTAPILDSVLADIALTIEAQ